MVASQEVGSGILGEENERLEGVGEKRVLSACPSMVSVKSFPPMNNLSAGLFPLIYLPYLQSTLLRTCQHVNSAAEHL
jgi:hypothetical protein